MITLQERYLVDAQGQRLGVFLDMADYQKVLEALAKLESLDEPSKISEPRYSVKELLDLAKELLNLALADRHPTTFTVEQQLFVAVVLRDQVELIEQMQRALKDFGVESPLPEEPVRCYDDLEVAALNTVTKEVNTQPTLLDLLDQVASQKEPKWVNYQNQLLLVVGSRKFLHYLVHQYFKNHTSPTSESDPTLLPSPPPVPDRHGDIQFQP